MGAGAWKGGTNKTKVVLVQQRAQSRMPTIAFVADTSSPNGAALLNLVKDVESTSTCLVGNDVKYFQGAAGIENVEIIVIVVFAGGNSALLSDLWPLCPQVKWVHSMAAGVETVVPILNALPRGPETPFTNAKGAFSRSLAEYSLAAMLHFNKQIPRLQNNRSSQVWQKFTMAELHGQTVGFVGFGDIAQATAKLCRCFGMKILALRQSSNTKGNDLADQVYVGSSDSTAKQEVFRKSDYIVCTLPGGDATKYFCGKAAFAEMKSTAVFISMGRGTCVDEAALVEALKAGTIAGAALDVFEVEPLPQESPLWSVENLLLSPHNADLTADYMKLTWDVFTDKLKAFSNPDFTGFPDQVDKKKGY